jgi:hypothetical protein
MAAIGGRGGVVARVISATERPKARPPGGCLVSARMDAAPCSRGMLQPSGQAEAHPTAKC